MNKNEPFQLVPVADTISGIKAASAPSDALTHYERLSKNLWLAPALQQFADNILVETQREKTAWGSISGPYGFGKTASAIALWDYARQSDYLAIPPLSCMNFDELAVGIKALAQEQAPLQAKKINKLFDNIWTTTLDQLVRREAKHYELTPRQLRPVYEDKLKAGQLHFDDSPHLLVHFLSSLGKLATGFSKGLIIVLDELQQLLGTLDARSIKQFREFVWGMRTEPTCCGIVICFDTLLEARLENWAKDILHRIREDGHSVQLPLIYDASFPTWLWQQLKTTVDKKALTNEILVSLGQFVERPDLANGPRTVVDVFSKAIEFRSKKKQSYDIQNLVTDIQQGHFRYFGESAQIQSILIQLLSDEWICEDETRQSLISILAAYPLGCPEATLKRFIPQESALQRARTELFGPLLVELSNGLALEGLQQVRRPNVHWERIIEQSWETLPALETLMDHAPAFCTDIIVPRLFPKWQPVSDSSVTLIGDWMILRGGFNEAFPEREVALRFALEPPTQWPQNVDLAITMVCDANSTAAPSAKLLDNKQSNAQILISMPLMRPIEKNIPAQLVRYHKYLEPEPFRALTILSAIHHLKREFEIAKGETEATDFTEISVALSQVQTLIETSLDFIISHILRGEVDVGRKQAFSVGGKELLHALFTIACQRQFPDYHTLMKSSHWRKNLIVYRDALVNSQLTPPQRRGNAVITMPKPEMYQVFGQNSTAAGDSFIRALGPLVVVTDSTKSFSLQLSMHPGETALYDYLLSVGRKQLVPLSAAIEFLRHKGYLPVETEMLVELLVARELLTRDDTNHLYVVKEVEAQRERLIKKIEASRKSMAQLGHEAVDESETLPLKALQEYANRLEQRVKALVSEQIDDAESGRTILQNLVGSVRAATMPSEWSSSDISTHLKGITTLLQKNQQELLNALRREIQKVSETLSPAPKDEFEWALAWRDRRQSFIKTRRSLEKRSETFIHRAQGLASWYPQNEQLLSVQRMCRQVQASDPASLLKLEQLVEEFREKFATEQWLPVSLATAFEKRLQAIQADVQTLLFQYNQAFQKERSQLVQDLAPFHPSSEAPLFVEEMTDDDLFSVIHARFQSLYRWAIDTYRKVFNDCAKRRAKKSEKWQHPTKSSVTWKTLEKQIEKLFKSVAKSADFKTVRDLGEKVNHLSNGFISVSNSDISIHPMEYDNPAQPPDFDWLAKMFREGKITISVSKK